ncbi:hypothetical protein QBC47DRAFT_380071 [Echria macrotheca]|uniref:Uncharacterized protein n=1 Tax=Echria macrotheca TaxID=438768 RepID=A0AAJ0BGP6_9PEZI|nr:hypothetical protein QBC47DRAFT_380071 [Echria macrotheca]
MADQLKSLITPELLDLVVDTIIPFSKSEPLDFAKIRREFGTPLDGWPQGVTEKLWPVLVALSKIDLSSTTDMTTFLPAPSDASFPHKALGLQMLIDQMPRRLCRGIHSRWTNMHFDVISLRLAEWLLTLPPDQQPHTWARWKDTVTLDYWVIARQWFGAPFVHDDTAASQERAIAFTDETRRQVEQATGTTDPHRAERRAILSDIYAFPRIIRGDNVLEDPTVQGYTYWMCMLMDVHKPIVDRFGHYPYRNAYAGRQDTPDEEDWFRETDDFARPSKEDREKLAKDIAAGVWTPLPPVLGSK